MVATKILPPTSVLLSVARPGSKSPDMVALINGHRVQFEIKNCVSPTSTIVPINTTVFHGELSPIDRLVSLLTSRPNDTLRNVIANRRSDDQSYGFPCDDGVVRSGKVPALRVKNQPAVLYDIRQYVIDHLTASKNTYLALVCQRPVQSVHLFYTGYGLNVLKASPLPLVRSAYLSTYGTADLNQMRVALKITLCPTQGYIHRVPR